MKREELIAHLIRLSQDFMNCEEPKGEYEESIAALESFLDQRSELIKELGIVTDQDSPELKQVLFELDSQVLLRINHWVSDIKIEIKNLHSQKEAAVKVKRSKGGYTKSSPSLEGYFIDKKK